MLRFFIFILPLLFAAENLSASKIIDLINRGRIDDARREIGEATTAVLRDGTLLYCQALLEADGDKSLQLLETALKSEMSPQYHEDNIYLMILYYMADGNYQKAISSSETYLQHWEDGKYRSEVLRLASIANAKMDRSVTAAEYLSRLTREGSGELYGFVGQLDQAGQLYDKKDYRAAQKICRNLRNVRHDEVVVPSLYLLSYYSIEQKRIDDAILYFNILKEGYPHAVGLDDLIDKFGRFEKRAGDQRAEEMTGTVYSVKVGVFSVKDNAEALAGRLKQYGKKLEIEQKIISDKKYYVVYVGRFLSSEEAMAFKSRLELSEKEAFQVVAR
ncbi:MAG: SPOR domain-containing protein [Candidatus Zixiibacteriota bacterium]|nr:MAG: SPOR domain-containing protein [candidate division Zixibacteria bacterium]